MCPSHGVCDLHVQAAGTEIQLSDTAWKPGHMKAEGKTPPALRKPDCHCSRCLVGQEWDLCVWVRVCPYVCVCRGRDGGGLGSTSASLVLFPLKLVTAHLWCASG